jgi:4-amino-4-deoxy-L-arabinose transferase-like glycosyltransferase
VRTAELAPTSSDVAAADAASRFRGRLAVVAAAALLARIFLVLWIPTQPVSDFRDYFRRAVSLKESGSYSVSPTPDAAYPPGYPVLLLLAISLPSGVGPLVAARMANAVLGGASVWIVGLVARELGGYRAGLAAALILAFHPRELLTACVLASENLFTPLLLLFVLLSVQAARASTGTPPALGAGILVGAMALTRSVAYGLGLVWAAGAIAARRRPRRVARELLLLLVAQHAVMLPWALRNRRELDDFTFLTSTAGIGLFAGNNANATGDWYPWYADLERLRPGINAGSPLAVDRAARAEAFRWMRDNPVRAGTLYLEKLRLILAQDYLAADWAIFAERIPPPESGLSVLPGPHPLKGHRRAVTTLLRVAGLLLAVMACAGAIVLVRASASPATASLRAGLATIVGCAAWLLFLSAIFAANGRYRWPVEDLCVPLAGVAIGRIRRREPANIG